MSTSTIVHITTFLQGGAGRVVTDLACAQRAAGHRVLVAVSATAEPGYESYPEYLTRLETAGVELVIVDSSFKRDAALNASFARTVRVRLDNDAPVIVHAHAAVPAHIARTVANAPVVQTMHGWSAKKRPEHVAQDLAILADVDAVVFPSAAARTSIEAIGARFRWSTVVPCGIPATRPRSSVPAPLAWLEQRRACGVRVLMTLGSLTAQKNHRVVVEALPSILRTHEAELVLIGEGPEAASLRERARALDVADHVHCIGYLPDAAAALAAADVFIQPSLTETFGLAVVEAFRARVPVVASDIPALAEIVSPGWTGWRFDPRSPERLSQAVAEALAASDPARSAMLDRAERMFLERFTIEAMVSGYEAVYESAMASARAACSTAASSSPGQNP